VTFWRFQSFRPTDTAAATLLRPQPFRNFVSHPLVPSVVAFAVMGGIAILGGVFAAACLTFGHQL
jgi:hypothetical protein